LKNVTFSLGEETQITKHTISLAIAVLLICVGLSGCFQKVSNTPETSTPPFQPPANGDWIVTQEQTIENEIIILNGDLTVKEGGNLKLMNVTLKLNCDYDGQYRITLEPGGSMLINRSNITAADLKYRFAFIVRGSAFVMSNSELHGCGWGLEGEDIGSGMPQPAVLTFDVAGLFIETEGAIIESNLITDCFGAIILEGNGSTVKSNDIYSNVFIPISIFGSDNLISDNTVRHRVPSGYGRYIDVLTGQNNTIAENKFIHDSHEDDAGVLGGIILYDTSDNMIVSNTFTDLNGGGIFVGATGISVSSNNIIAYNNISAYESGINIHGRNNRIEGNSIRGVQTGIDLAYSYNNVVANNSLSRIGILHGIRMCHSSNNNIINNQISVEDSGGIYIWRLSKNNILKGNTISSTEQGMFVFYSSDNNVINGNVISSDSRGIILDECSGNMIHGNSFTGIESYDSGDNQWDYNNEGNYWSDYVGQDLNGDGIGDDPYTLRPKGIDNYPLIDPATIIFTPITTPEPIEFEQPPTNIDINDEETWENQTITLETQLNIQDGGNLTLRNTNLILGSESHSGYIWVNPGGSLYIYESIITDSENGYGGRLFADKGTTIVMKNSEWHGVYYSWWSDGFEIFADDVIFENNTIMGVTIKLLTVSGAHLVNNRILNALSPLQLVGSSNCNIENNTISKSQWASIELMRALWIDAEGEPSNNLIMGNRILDSWSNGIVVEYFCDNNIFRDNDFSNIRFSSIRVIGNNNLIYHNNFRDPAHNSQDKGNNNTWDYNSTGNYWSDYTGTDEDNDGIGDIPFRIPPNGVDNYPLMIVYE